MVQFYYGKREMHKLIAHKPGVGNALYEEAKERDRIASGLLAEERATTTHQRVTLKGYKPARISSQRSAGGVDAEFSLHAPNALALEFGHDPSGVFAGTDTKSPDGLFILTRAAYS